jgi:hypothetical protein
MPAQTIINFAGRLRIAALDFRRFHEIHVARMGLMRMRLLAKGIVHILYLIDRSVMTTGG